MRNYYMIRAKNRDTGEINYLGVDSSAGGVPYWTTGTGEPFNPENTPVVEALPNVATKDVFGNVVYAFPPTRVLKVIKSIRADFGNKSGYHYSNEIDINTLECVKVGIVEIISFSEEKVSMQDIEDAILEQSVKEKLSPEELAFVQRKRH